MQQAVGVDLGEAVEVVEQRVVDACSRFAAPPSAGSMASSSSSTGMPSSTRNWRPHEVQVSTSASGSVGLPTVSGAWSSDGHARISSSCGSSWTAIAFSSLSGRGRSPSTSSRSAATAAASAASMFRRSSGSVFDGRRLNQPPSGSSTVSPSSSSRAHPVAAGERLLDRRHPAGLVVDRRVDLPGRGVAAVGRGQLGQRTVLLAERREHVQRGEHAGVGAPEVAEVVVRGVLAAEDRVGAGHLGLDERVADAGADRLAAVLGARSPGRPWT